MGSVLRTDVRLDTPMQFNSAFMIFIELPYVRFRVNKRFCG